MRQDLLAEELETLHRLGAARAKWDAAANNQVVSAQRAAPRRWETLCTKPDAPNRLSLADERRSTHRTNWNGRVKTEITAKSLYHRLYNSLPTQGHSQRENFLTEAFADLMNRLERGFPSDAHRFIADTLLGNIAVGRSAQSLAQRIQATQHLYWDTQHTISLGGSLRKRPDIIVTLDEKCALLVEVKIAAAFTKRLRHRTKVAPVVEKQDSNEQQHGDVFFQLDDYGRWLAGHHPDSALVLLTHSKEAPSDFLTGAGDSRYAVHLRSVCHWRAVYNWLRNWTIIENGDTDTERLALDFLKFLEEVGMSEMNEKDVQLLNGLSSFYRRWSEQKVDLKIKDALLVAREVVDRVVPSRAADGAPKLPGWDDVDFAFWDWFYPYASPDDLDLHLAWGFADPENAHFFRTELNLHPRLQAFVYVQGNAALRAIQSDRYKLWTPITDGIATWWIQTRDAAEFARSPLGFTQAFVQWLQPLAKESSEILASAWKTFNAGRP
jgi:hypothetical protein